MYAFAPVNGVNQLTNRAEMGVRAVLRLSGRDMQTSSRWPHRLCPALGRQQRRLAIPGRSKLLRRRGFRDADLYGQCLDVRHRYADVLIQAVQSIVPVPQHACANRVETGGVLNVLDDLRNGGCHRCADRSMSSRWRGGSMPRNTCSRRLALPPAHRVPLFFFQGTLIGDSEQVCAAWVLISWCKSDQNCRHRQSAPCPPWPSHQRPGQS